jgi:hypothetical protein
MSVATGPKTNFHSILSAMMRNSISAIGSTFSRLSFSATSKSLADATKSFLLRYLLPAVNGFDTRRLGSP